MAAANLATIRRNLLSWYDAHKRDLPWRRTSDPYAIWISETMLQQTQVSTVIPYYNGFMKMFPNIKALDRAPLSKVLALWTGLGYYHRAQNLKRTARILTARHGGKLPDDAKKLSALPGIGDYTAGAILSIAFGKPHPAVDGNARRVLARLFLLSRESELRDAALRLLSKTNPGHFNQSLMELGSVLCAPKNPRCGQCPVASFCPTYRYGRRLATRPLRKAVQTRSVTWPLAIVRCDGKLLLRRRTAKGILAGLWEFPGGENASPRYFQTLLEGHLPGFENRGPRPIGEISHAITNRRIRAPVFLVELTPTAKSSFSGSRWRWVAPKALDRYPTSSMTGKAFRFLTEYEKNHP